MISKPSKYLLAIIKKTNKQLQEGRHSPIFDNVTDAIAWLNGRRKDEK